MALEATKGINEGLIQNGYIVVADTIEELAEGLGLPAETLKKTVEHQNENYDAGKQQRPYSLGRIIMPLIHKRGFPLLNPKLARHLGRTLRPNRIEHANTLTYRICKRPSGFHEEHCRIADDATKPQITRASAAALQPNQAIPA